MKCCCRLIYRSWVRCPGRRGTEPFLEVPQLNAQLSSLGMFIESLFLAIRARAGVVQRAFLPCSVRVEHRRAGQVTIRPADIRQDGHSQARK